MKIWDGISKVSGFRALPTTIVVTLVYASIFSLVFWTNGLVKVPKNQKGLDFERAYFDLHSIAARPHPFNSHANDDVREYLLKRVKAIAKRHGHVQVSDDLFSNASFAIGGTGISFEGTNILVKVEGTDEDHHNRGGVLFSAHYDSVSTSSGAIDDGMGVTTLLQMIEFLADHRPRRTAVFNINNGEEDGLHGAHVFLEHPWSNITDTFLNLEGAASGGRPMMFRATSAAPLRSFGKVKHPHVNVLSADGFKRGLIRSSTDYSVYAKGLVRNGSAIVEPMEGLDYAFYENRAQYHTKLDSIPYINGGRRSLWAMMEGTREAGMSLLNDDKTHDGPGSGSAIYFELFNMFMVSAPLQAALIYNIVMLLVGPVILALLLFSSWVVQHNRLQAANGTNVTLLEGLKELSWVSHLWRWFKFWVALFVSAGAQVLLVFAYTKLNPWIVYSSPYLVLTSTFSLAYLAMVLTLNLPIKRSGITLPEQQKSTVLLQIYALTWVLMLMGTIALAKLSVGAVYIATIWNSLAFIGCVLASLESLMGARGTVSTEELDGEAPVRRSRVSGVRYTMPSEIEAEAQEEETAATEITPLIQHQREVEEIASGEKEEAGAIGHWLLQLVVVLPIPVTLVAHVAVFVMAAMAQTLSDGMNPALIYGAASLLSLLAILPVAPFSFKLHRTLTTLMMVIFVASTAYNLLVFPFTREAPLKVYFQQSLTLAPGHEKEGPRAITTMVGPKGWLDEAIVPQLPSTWRRDVICADDKKKAGLVRCAWEGGLIPSPQHSSHKSEGNTAGNWLTYNVSRTSATSARFAVKGRNTRSCRIYFDSRTVSTYRVHGSSDSGEVQAGWEAGEGGIDNVRLWSRTWDREWVADVTWTDHGDDEEKDARKEPLLSGRVACEWAEFGSGQMPAFDEALAFVPAWSVVSKLDDGLVEVSKPFEV